MATFRKKIKSALLIILFSGVLSVMGEPVDECLAGKQILFGDEGLEIVPVEYIESTGTQWIDTGYILAGPTTFRLSATFLPTWGEFDFFGAYATGISGSTICGTFRYLLFGSNNPNDRIDSAKLGSSEISANIEYALGVSSRVLAVNQNTYYGSGANFPNLTVTLFRGSLTANYAQMKCYAFQIYDALGTLVSDYTPVRVGYTGYMYDQVTGTLFGNEGEGEFIVGPDL